MSGSPSDDATVVALRVRAACGSDAIAECSGTMVSARAMLTAAHCVDDTPPGLLEVVTAQDATDPDAPSIRVAEIFVIEGADLAIVALTEAWAGVPASLGDVPTDAQGREVTIAGYGDDGDGAPGLRREGTAIVDVVEDDALVLVPGPALTCGGDSGGPVSIDGAVIAVTSFGDPACAQTTTAVRLDAHRGFIDDAIAMAATIPTGVPGPGVPDCGGDDGCCSSGGGGGLGAVVLLLALLAACSRSPEPECTGTLQGAAPPDGTLQWCVDGDGKKHGVLREWKPGGQLVMQARFVHGTQDGPFARWFDDGTKRDVGAYAAGLRAGPWTEWHANGNRKRDAEYLADGTVKWTLYHEDDGHRWIEGGSRQQREHGHFVEWYPGGGKAAEGEFVDGEKTGTWSYWTPDGAVSDVEQGAYAPGAFGDD